LSQRPMDMTARVWDAETGKAVGVPIIHGYVFIIGLSIINSASFSPDGKRVVTASDTTARVWDAETGKPVGVPMMHASSIHSASFSPNGKRVVTASDTTARVWDAETGKPVGGPMTHTSFVSSASFSPDGKRVVTASFDHTSQVWDVYWSSFDRPDQLIAEVCSKKLRGNVHTLTPTDVSAAKILPESWIGNDVCDGVATLTTQ
jgi:WD40 repeat protein